MARYRMPAHIVRHSLAVCAVALYLTQGLVAKGFPLDPDLVRAGALLHDITKVHSLQSPLDHALTGAKLVKKLGYPRIAVIVRQHVRLSRSRPRGRITETEVVNYADKRVVNDQVTTLADRLGYIRKRYGRNPEAAARIEKFSALAYRLEKEIFSVLPGEPGQLLNIDLEKEISAI